MKHGCCPLRPGRAHYPNTYLPPRRYWSVLLIQSARGGLNTSRSTVSASASALCGMCGGMVSTSPAFTTISLPSTQNFSAHARSEEHTSELQSRLHLVCRL